MSTATTTAVNPAEFTPYHRRQVAEAQSNLDQAATDTARRAAARRLRQATERAEAEVAASREADLWMSEGWGAHRIPGEFGWHSGQDCTGNPCSPAPNQPPAPDGGNTPPTGTTGKPDHEHPLIWTTELLDTRYGLYVSYLANPISDIVRGDLTVADWNRRDILEALVRGIERTSEIQKVINDGEPCLMMNEAHTDIIRKEAADLLAAAVAEANRRDADRETVLV